MSEELKKLVDILVKFEEMGVIDIEIAAICSGDYKECTQVSDLVDALKDELSYMLEDMNRELI